MYENIESVNDWQKAIVAWRIGKGFHTGYSNFPEKIMLIITELGRAVDYHREDNKKMIEHELTDGLIRYLDVLGSLGFDTNKNLVKIMENNHRRIRKHGKKY